jgi:hypothetical protein
MASYEQNYHGLEMEGPPCKNRPCTAEIIYPRVVTPTFGHWTATRNDYGKNVQCLAIHNLTHLMFAQWNEFFLDHQQEGVLLASRSS